MAMHGFKSGIAKENAGQFRIEDAHCKLPDTVGNLGGIGFDPKRRQTGQRDQITDAPPQGCRAVRRNFR
jgi:hypothetical protein